MTQTTAGIMCIVLGLAFSVLAVFAWPLLEKLPINRLRASIFGSGFARGMTIAFAVLVAAMGAFLLLTAE